MSTSRTGSVSDTTAPATTADHALRALVLTHVFPRSADDPSAPFLLTWARALRAAGVDVGVVAPHDAGLPTRQVVGGVPVLLPRYAPARLERLERLAYRGEMHHLARSPAGLPLVAGLLGVLARALRAQARAGRPDLLHVHWWLPGAVVARLAGTGLPTVVTVHGTDVALLESRPGLSALARWALAGAGRVEAVSAALARRLEAATGRPADAVNPMPLHPDRLAAAPATGRSPAAAGRPGGGLRVLAAGRLVPEKGFADLVEAAAACPVPLRLTIVGDGPRRQALADLARARGVDLVLPGALSPTDLGRAYADADVVAQPSHAEGLGLVAAEALAAGVPVVATDSGGASDLLERGDLVPVGDVPALASALARVAADPASARARARVLGERVRPLLSPDAAARRTLCGYRSLLGRA